MLRWIAVLIDLQRGSEGPLVRLGGVSRRRF